MTDFSYFRSDPGVMDAAFLREKEKQLQEKLSKEKELAIEEEPLTDIKAIADRAIKKTLKKIQENNYGSTN